MNFLRPRNLAARSWQLAALVTITTHPLTAQDTAAVHLAAAVRERVSAATLEPHAREIVRHERPSGSPGENAAIDYIVRTLRAAGVPVEVYPFQAHASDPVSARVQVVGTDFSPEAITMSYSGSAQGLEGPLRDVGTLEDLPELEVGTGERLTVRRGAWNGPDLRGAVALVTGQPRNIPTTILAELGAIAIIYVNPEERLNDLIVTSTWGTPSLRNYHRLPTIPVVQVKRSDGDRLRESMGSGAPVRLEVEVSTGWKEQRIAVARIPAGATADPERAPFVLFGGHIDGWYHGGTDEGASNAAMVELARAFYAERARLRRGLVVAWWPGHSNGRYAGSTWFADHFFEELRERAVAYVNVDGIGQMDAKRFGAATTMSLAGLAQRVVRDREGVEIRPGRPGRNSDQSFNGIGLPLLQLNHTRLAEDGGYWWWHTPDDTYDKIDFDVLKTDTDLYVDALADLLAAPTLPIDMSAEVGALGDVLRRRARESDQRFDFDAALARTDSLVDIVQQLETDLRSRPSAETDLTMLRVLRPLYRVLYSPSSPFHPDPGVDSDLLPGLSPVHILRDGEVETDRFGFAWATLVRERNRVMEALRMAMVEALRGLR